MGNERPSVDLSETESAVEPHCALVLLKADQAQPRESIRYRLLLGREKACADAAAAMFRKNGNARDEKAAIVAKLNQRSQGRVGV